MIAVSNSLPVEIFLRLSRRAADRGARCVWLLPSHWSCAEIPVSNRLVVEIFCGAGVGRREPCCAAAFCAAVLSSDHCAVSRSCRCTPPCHSPIKHTTGRIFPIFRRTSHEKFGGRRSCAIDETPRAPIRRDFLGFNAKDELHYR